MYDEGGTSYYEGDWKDHLRHGKGYRKYRFVCVCSSNNHYLISWYDWYGYNHSNSSFD